MSITIGTPTRTITYIFVDDLGNNIPFVEVMIVRFEDKIPYGFEEYEKYYTETDDLGKIVMNLDDKNYHVYARKEGYEIYPDYTLVGIEYWYAGNYTKYVRLYRKPPPVQEIGVGLIPTPVTQVTPVPTPTPTITPALPGWLLPLGILSLGIMGLIFILKVGRAE